MPAKLPVEVKKNRGKSHMTLVEYESRQEQEPKVDEIKRLRAPDYLPEYLRREFNALGQELIKAKLLTKLDADILARYLMSRDSWAAAHIKARDALDMDDPAESGAWARIAKTYFDQCHVCASSMGLTISSRCRLVVPQAPKEEESEMDKMMRERAGARRKA